MDFEDIEKELLESWKENEEKGRFHSALILLAKLVFLKLDRYFYENFGIIPKDHEERFYLTERYLGEEIKYHLFKIYQAYREAYRTLINETRYVEVKIHAQRIFSRVG